MTSRERWILYPILFLTLGITMRDKVIPPRLTAEEITAERIRCNYIEAGRAECPRLDTFQTDCRVLVVSDGHGREAARLGSIPKGGGRLELFAQDGKNRIAIVGVDEAGTSGMVETLDKTGAPLTQLRCNEAGGVVSAGSRDAKTWVVMGHTGREYGVFAESTELGRRVPLTLPWRFETDKTPTEPVTHDTPDGQVEGAFEEDADSQPEEKSAAEQPAENPAEPHSPQPPPQPEP